MADGEILGFLGSNGAGKMTTVKMRTGQMRPREGKDTLLGMEITQKTEKVQAQIGVCFEVANLYEQMMGIENLKLFAQLFSIKSFDVHALRLSISRASSFWMSPPKGWTRSPPSPFATCFQIKPGKARPIFTIIKSPDTLLYAPAFIFMFPEFPPVDCKDLSSL